MANLEHNNSSKSEDDPIAVMMFGKNASLIAKTAPELFQKYGIKFHGLSEKVQGK